ncbi:hypothetical protein [Rufibacter sp. XAAS-G3-1]|uniref:hypothetical protein n=1 Tax=Rufibacter sp. XAAS-G3-1 TaxID=2729134 RepID=UPI0015E7BC16|nr:hypothetical protein [Rufibacter sp. XAAS-G3-1]
MNFPDAVRTAQEIPGIKGGVHVLQFGQRRGTAGHGFRHLYVLQPNGHLRKLFPPGHLYLLYRNFGLDVLVGFGHKQPDDFILIESERPTRQGHDQKNSCYPPKKISGYLFPVSHKLSDFQPLNIR